MLTDVRSRRAGLLKVPTGRLIACDPGTAMFLQDAPGFAHRFPIGEWPVTVYAARSDSRGTNGVHLAAAVCVGDAPVQRWAFARPLRMGPRLAGAAEPEEPAEPWGVSVDGGLAAFVDKAGMPALGQLAQDALDDGCPGDGPLGIPLQESICIELPDAELPANVVIFGAGVGDGGYPCFVGVAADGRPAVLLILFDTFDARATAAAIGKSLAATADEPDGEPTD
ncbi:MAG TPA: DUF4241 domain-containing protein [Humisphaera sp.]